MTKRRHTGGRRKDRCFKILLHLPSEVSEDKVMDFLEEIISKRILEIGIDPSTVCVKRRDPSLYGET